MRARLRPLGFLGLPTALLAAFFLAPMLVMLVIALQFGVLSGATGWTLTNFGDVLGDPLYRDVALTTFEIATVAMLIQLASRSRSPTCSPTRRAGSSSGCCSSSCSPTSSTRWSASTRGGCCSGARG